MGGCCVVIKSHMMQIGPPVFMHVQPVNVYLFFSKKRPLHPQMGTENNEKGSKTSGCTVFTTSCAKVSQASRMVEPRMVMSCLSQEVDVMGNGELTK